MDEAVDTGFKDKSGRTIFEGDILQHRLGKFGKASGGSSNFRVIRHGKKYHLVGESQTDVKYGGMLLTDKLCEYIIVLKSDHMPR